MVIVRDDMLRGSQGGSKLPVMMNYRVRRPEVAFVIRRRSSLIYIVRRGAALARAVWRSGEDGQPQPEKAQFIYDVIDDASGFYRGHAARDNRSLMNITFRLP